MTSQKRPAKTDGQFGARPSMMKPTKPPTQGPKGNAGDSRTPKK